MPPARPEQERPPTLDLVFSEQIADLDSAFWSDHALRICTVSGKLNQIAAAARKLTEAKLITGANPNRSASGAVIRGAVMLITLPQLKIDAAVERKWGG